MLKNSISEKHISKQKSQSIQKNKNFVLTRSKDTMYAILFLLPAILILGIFIFYPMIKTFIMSFFLSNNMGQLTVFAGLDNYKSILTSSSFLSSLGTTFIYVIAVTFFTILISLILASLANQHLKGISFFRTIFSSTMGVSVSVAGIFWLFLYNPSVGVLSQISQKLHLPGINWLADPKFALTAVTITTIWMEIGFTFLLFFGALQNVPENLYDAANIAGVSQTKQLFKITIPMISPTLFFASIITLIGAFKSFGLIDLMTAGGPNNSTNLLIYHIYQDAFINNNYSQSSTESIILTIIIAIMTLIQFKVLEKRVNY